MKKFFSLMLVVLMLASMMTVSSNAAYSKTEAPDWMITKVCPDTGDIDGTYPATAKTVNGDIFECFEMVNISGKTLNLYDYCVTYNGNDRTHEDFEKKVVEMTPFKAGDFRDGSTFEWPNMPKNPDTCMVAPGEVVVVWSTFIENWPECYGNGNASIEDFRKHWKVPADVKVIAWDGNSSTAEFQSGNSMNFNLKNSKVGSYGIAKISDIVEGTSTYDDVITWTNVDYTADIIAITNFNFTALYGYDATSDDVRRAKYLDYTDEFTMGVLTDAQKASFGDLLKARESADTTAAPETTAAPAETTAAPAVTTAPATTTPATADSTVIVAGMLVMATALTLALRKKSAK